MAHSRVADRVVAYPWLVLTALIVSVPVFVLMLWFDFGFDRYFAFFGVVLSFVFPYLVDKRMNRRNPKKVVFVASSPSQFANEVWNGIHQRLTSSNHRWSLSKNILAGEVSGSELARVVRSEVSNGADALCLLPTHANNEFWNSVERALFASVEVIVIDVKPPEYLLSTPGRSRPYFVAGDYFEGGRLLGRAIVEDLQSDLSANAIVLVGPNQYFAGRTRSREILGEIASASLLPRVVAIPVDQWLPDQEIYETIGDAMSSMPASILIYCLHDGLTRSIADLARSRGINTSRLRMYAYDGIRSPDGRIDAIAHGNAFCTVDVRPLEQGELIGEILNEIRSGGERRAPFDRTTTPKLEMR